MNPFIMLLKKKFKPKLITHLPYNPSLLVSVTLVAGITVLTRVVIVKTLKHCDINIFMMGPVPWEVKWVLVMPGIIAYFTLQGVRNNVVTEICNYQTLIWKSQRNNAIIETF